MRLMDGCTVCKRHPWGDAPFSPLFTEHHHHGVRGFAYETCPLPSPLACSVSFSLSQDQGAPGEKHGSIPVARVGPAHTIIIHDHHHHHYYSLKLTCSLLVKPPPCTTQSQFRFQQRYKKECMCLPMISEYSMEAISCPAIIGVGVHTLSLFVLVCAVGAILPFEKVFLSLLCVCVNEGLGSSKTNTSQNRRRTTVKTALINNIPPS
mmetsp:Transcript_72366/g.109172  ORF Transcript_72366/g.109172 Transcript_72366/m.109172 type:complete len:207 (-) Transcript_72366:58-678(-)